jgi:hypothetical protein
MYFGPAAAVRREHVLFYVSGPGGILFLSPQHVICLIQLPAHIKLTAPTINPARRPAPFFYSSSFHPTQLSRSDFLPFVFHRRSAEFPLMLLSLTETPRSFPWELLI